MLMGELLYALVWRFGSDFVQLRAGSLKRCPRHPRVAVS
jgi:hypothetical protein